MRVIAGKYRGRRLNSPSDGSIRPTTDKTKEALFNILRGDIEDAVVVDLFAGSGSLGIEALSRGAKKVFFCDIDNRALALVRSNLGFCDPSEYEIIKGDFSDCLRRLAARGVKADAVLCDPPYRFKKGNEIIAAVCASGILKPGAAVTVERATEDGALPDRQLFLESSRRYGSVSVDLFRNYRKAAVTGTFDPFTNGHRFLVEEALRQFDAVYAVLLINENKTAEYPIERRVKMAETALRDFKKRVRVEFYDGFAADYCKERGIKYIIRGVRTPADAAYEREMADFNFRRAGVETLFIPAVRPDISSTSVRETWDKDGDVTDMVDGAVIPYLSKEE